MQWFNNLKVTRRFALISSLILVFVLALAGVSMWGSNQLHSLLNRVEETQIPEILNAAEALNLIQSTRADIYGAINSPIGSNLEQATAAIQQKVLAAKNKINIYTSSPQSEEEQVWIPKIKEAATAWENEMTEVITLAKASNPTARQQAQAILGQSHFQPLIDDLTPILGFNEREVKANQQQASQTFQLVSGSIVGFTLVVLIIIFTALGLLTRSIIKMTRDLQNLNSEIKQAFSKIEEKRQFGEVISTRLKSMTTELNATSNQQLSGSQEQVTAIREVTSSLSELSYTAQNIANNVRHIDQMASGVLNSTQTVKAATLSTNEVGKRGEQAIQKTIRANQKVSQFNEVLVQSLTELFENSSELKEVNKLLRNISDETHLLSLNAKIEAAGAGEYGERFGIVAGAVRELADRNMVSNRDVSAILSNFQARLEQAVASAESGQHETKTALLVAEESGSVIGELISAIQQSAEEVEKIEQAVEVMVGLTQEIKLATSQQHSASAQTVQVLQEVGVVASQNANGSSQVNATVSDLEELSSELNQVLAA